MKKLKGFNFNKLKELFSASKLKSIFKKNKSESIQPNALKNNSLFSYDSFYNSIFSDKAHKNIHKLFVTSSIISASYLTGRILEQPIENKLMPADKTNMAQSQYTSKRAQKFQSILNNDLFMAQGSPQQAVKQKKKSPKTLICKISKRKSRLPLKLIQTTVLQDEIKSVASVQVRGKKASHFFNQGDQIKNIARLDSITPFAIIIKNLKSGECEKVEVKRKKDLSAPKIQVLDNYKITKKYNGIENIGNNFSIKKSYRDKMLGNMSEILTQARAIPIKNPDGTSCYKMVEVVADSLYTKLNIKNNDIICGVNGNKFKNMNQVMNLFGSIRDIDNFELSVRRDGLEQSFEYKFVE